MDRLFNKIVIVSLCENFSRKVGKTLAQELGMIFCDTKDLLEYELIDRESIKKICTAEYLESAEKSVFQRIANFEDVVVAISCDNLMHNFETLEKKSLIVFLQTSQEFVKNAGEKINAISFASRTKQLKTISTFSIDLKETEEYHVCEKIIEALGGIL